MELQDLYQELIIDHGTCPRNQGDLPNANHQAEGINPVCGDQIQVLLDIQDQQIQAARFQGSGCAICMASASLMTEHLVGHSNQEALQWCTQFREALTTCSAMPLCLPKLEAFLGVRAFPSRIKCATLAWHTLETAILRPATRIKVSCHE